MAKLFFLLLLCVMLASGVDIAPRCQACTNIFMTALDTKGKLDGALGTLFKNSLFYLFTSYTFAGQNVERKGMTKYLRRMSDDTWEEGLECMKKILERGGRIDKIEFEIEKESLANNVQQHKAMTDAKERVEEMINHYNGLYFYATKETFNDADLALFFSKKMRQSTEKYRELVAHTIELQRLNETGAGIAFDIFDASL